MPDYTLTLGTAAAVPLLEVQLDLPRAGAWTADVLTTDLSLPNARAGMPAVLDLLTTQFRGTVLRGGPVIERGSEYVRMVGGAGGLGKNATPQGYSNVPAQQLVSALLSSVGERLSPQVALSGTLASWWVRAEPVAVALTRVCDALGIGWRVLPDGSVWLGTETWPPATLTSADLMDVHPERGEWLMGIVGAEILPGQSVTLPGYTYAGRVSTVAYHVHGGGKARMRVWLEDG